ncbi:hypothetical protein ACFLSW_00945 [Candidatus Bipolaricaulota bacterium]
MNKKLRWTLATITLLVGVIAFTLAAQPGGGDANQGDKPPMLDVAGAAITLEVTEEALITALGLPEAPPEGERPERGERPEQGEHERPDLGAAAETLGITEEALMTALGDPEQGRPDLAATAEALGITEEILIDALGLPERVEGEGPQHEGPKRPQIDFATAAEILGVTEEALIEALGVPEGGLQGDSQPQGGPHGGGRR